MESAITILKKCSNNYCQLQTYQDSGVVKCTVTTFGNEKTAIESKFITRFRSPNLFNFDIKQILIDDGFEERREIVANTKGFFERFSQAKLVPLERKDLRTSVNGLDVGLDCLPPIAKIFFPEIEGPSLESIVEPRLSLIEKISGEDCFLIRTCAVSQTDLNETSIWISTSKYLILRTLHRQITDTVRTSALRLSEISQEDFSLMIQVVEEQRNSYDREREIKSTRGFVFENETTYSQIYLNKEISEEFFEVAE